MRRVLPLILVLVTSNALAVAPQFWRVHTADELLSGEIEGFAVTARGELRPGPGLKKLAAFSDPFVLSQVAGPNGDRYFGTGNDGKVYRLRGSENKVIFTAAEPEVYALAFRDGALYAATSPNGKVYRIDPADGKSTVFYEPKQAYIWDIEFLAGGDLLVATGVEGKLFRVSPKGDAKLVFTAPETHARSLAVRADGSILLGGSGKGRIYQITPEGRGHALYDSALSEISTVFVDPSGSAWAAGASTTLPSSAPAPKSPKPAAAAAGSAGEQKKEGEAAAAPPEVTVSFEEGPAGGAGGGSSELYRIDRDGFVETVRKFERELIYGIASAPEGGLLLATGPQGRIYTFRDGEIALSATVPQKQVVSVSSAGGTTLVTTTNSGAVYQLETTSGGKAEFRSAAKDVERFSRFGQYRIEGSGLSRDQISVAFRSGNTRTPDATWSPWSQPVEGAEGSVNAPPGRYLQWKLLASKASPSMVIDSVTVSFVNRNVAPVIDGVSVAEPAVIFISSAYPASAQVVEATNPDEYGIFTSLDAPRDKNDPGKKAYRKGFRTITWRAHDDNGDSLRYSVAFRREGSGKWLRLRDNIEETQINFDTSQLPDGKYDLRITATDANDNADAPLTDVREGIEFRVDNTPPAIAMAPSGESVTVRVTDASSPVAKVEYSIDAEKWLRATPADGISDSPSETYSFPRATVTGKFVIVRAMDAFYNVSTASVNVP